MPEDSGSKYKSTALKGMLAKNVRGIDLLPSAPVQKVELQKVELQKVEWQMVERS